MTSIANIEPGQPATSRQAKAPAMIFVSDKDSESVIRQSMSDLGVEGAEFKSGTIETATAALALHPSPRLLFVDLSGVAEPFKRIEELAEKCEPDVSVVAIGDKNDIVLYRRLINEGIAEYFFKPLVPDQIKRTCNILLNGRMAETQASARAGKLVFIVGVRGGVGATTIAANAAWRLAEKGQRWVSVVDFNLQYGDAALQLDTAPSRALHEALEKPERIDKIFLERATIHAGERLDLLASLEPLSDPLIPSQHAITSLLAKLQQRYRFVFVDVPPFLALGPHPMLSLPSTCILVGNASLASARELARWRELIGHNTSERRTLTILNMSGAAGALPEAEFIRATGGQAPDITIPFDRDLAMAANLGIRATQKCTAFNRGLMQLLRSLAGERDAAPRSLLSKIFGRF